MFFWKTPWGAHMCHGPFCFLMEQTQGTAPGVKNRQGKKRLRQWGFCYYFYMPCYGEDEARASSAFALHRAARGAPPTCSSPHRSSGLSCTEQVCPKSWQDFLHPLWFLQRNKIKKESLLQIFEEGKKTSRGIGEREKVKTREYL